MSDESTSTTISTFYNVCLSDKHQLMHGSPFELYLQKYFYPLVALFGVLGNALNLTVLLNRTMRSRANTFLAILAFADICFLLLLTPNIAANYSWFTFNFYFRAFYFRVKDHCIALANWCSAVAIWCVIAVCTDRLVGIRKPLYVRSDWRWWAMPTVIGSIVLGTGALTFYQHFEYDCPVRLYCQDTQIYSKCLPVYHNGTWFQKNQTNPYSPEFQRLMLRLVWLYALLMIIVPIVLLSALNALLLWSLRQRHKHFPLGGVSQQLVTGSEKLVLHNKTEHRVTLTVAFIVTAFTVTNGPSAAIHLVRSVYEIPQQAIYDVTMLCSTLVICGKASNFILFCLSSKHFRHRLFRLARKKVNSKIETLATNISSAPAIRRLSSLLPDNILHQRTGNGNSNNHHHDNNNPLTSVRRKSTGPPALCPKGDGSDFDGGPKQVRRATEHSLMLPPKG